MTEAELLFTEILNCNRLFLYLNREVYLDGDKCRFISSVLKRRIEGLPIQYILGKTEFMGFEFQVNRNTFIPRPETEILVETALKIAQLLNCQTVKLLDLGTGSGNIAISLAKFLSQAEIFATDISKKALEVALVNARLNNVKINFLQSNLFNNCNPRTNTYNLIVSNPPYIPTSNIESLQREINYEPRVAIDGGEDGLSFYHNVIKQAPLYLKEDGFLILEMGFKQSGAIKNIFQNSGSFRIIEVVRDYNNIERVIVAQKLRIWTN